MFQSVGKVIERKGVVSGLQKSLEAAVILAKINNSGNRQYTATSFRTGCLTLVSPDPIVGQELMLRRLHLIAELNQLFDTPLITRVVIRSQ